MEHIDNELIQVLSGEYLVAGGDDRVPPLGLQATCLSVREGCGALDAHHRADKGRKWFVSGDRVVLDGPLGLRSPQRVGWDVYLTERVLFPTRRHREVE